MDHADVLQRAATALGELPVRGFVTTGPAIPAGLDRCTRECERRGACAAQRGAAPCPAVVTHAGHGTVIKSLAAGVPVVAMPLGRDQRTTPPA